MAIPEAPTIGRIVHYHPPESDPIFDEPLAAIVTAPSLDGVVDLTVFPPGGNSYPVENVAHADDARVGIASMGYWSWPPRS